MQENDGRIVSNFLVQALKGLPITIYGDGKQTRSFCYVDDLIDGLLRLMATPDEVIGPVNLGNPEELSAMSLARRIAALLRIEPAIAYKPLPIDDPKRRRPDIRRAKALLDWEPRTSLDEGLKRTAAYFSARFAAAKPKRKSGVPVPRMPAAGEIGLDALPAAGIT
jgi:UDP-glucuronate decarboxylase